MQRKLLSETNLDLKRALELSQGMEAAEKNTRSLKQPESLVQKVMVPAKKSSLPACSRCGRSNHQASNCKFVDAQLWETGAHIAPVCRSSPKAQNASQG